MTKVLLLLLVLFLVSLLGCKSAPLPAQNVAAPTAAPTAAAAPSASVMAVAPTLAMPSPGNTVVPSVVPGGDKAKGDQKTLPPAIWDRMTRALTREEIEKLPPETRDMILRAQGRLPASPTPAPKKK